MSFIRLVHPASIIVLVALVAPGCAGSGSQAPLTDVTLHPPSASTSPTAGAAASAQAPSVAPSATAPRQTGARVPVPTSEPPCTDGNTVRFHKCFVPTSADLGAPLLELPFDNCPATVAALRFSPKETARQRAKTPDVCCYLDRCQLSYGY